MQMEQAQILRRNWGDKPCDHPTLDKAYLRDEPTGLRVCTTCGRGFNQQEANELVARHINRPDEESPEANA